MANIPLVPPGAFGPEQRSDGMIQAIVDDNPQVKHLFFIMYIGVHILSIISVKFHK